MKYSEKLDFLKTYDEVDNESVFILAMLGAFLKICAIVLLTVYNVDNTTLFAMTLSLIASMSLLTGYAFDWKYFYLIYIGISYFPIIIIYSILIQGEFSQKLMLFRSFTLANDGFTVTSLLCTAVFVLFMFMQTVYNVIVYKGFLFLKENSPDSEELSSINSSESDDNV
ncbi:unnamed protein product [Bursaphelenchus xylophilus]|uniref:(pine wood nematode) hypothetical protein n=1 Tax=Bursaphelenchus xylophilus TaxID=6326 RepID=A0A1I7SBA8_BURXY|nr:unnamed protein product [Bursaphelenchus xylophilus]CAG9131984.1 unnamed protein product [Bursaphelenchus xylophilus]